MISVIIPSYNSENTIKQCLGSLINQTYEGEYEIILVDSSDDKTPEIVNSQYPNVKLVHLKSKTDPGTARNIGIRQARGEIIALIDSDCFAMTDWLKRIVEAHGITYNIVGGVVVNGNAVDDIIGWAGYLAEFREFLPGLPKMEVNHIPTCNISYKRIIFERYGSFQGKYYPQEDLIFNYGLIRQGERILRDPSIVVAHQHRSGLLDFLHHQKRIGTVTAKVLKVTGQEGSFLARYTALAILTQPLLFAVKFARTIIAFLKYQPRAIVNRPFVLIPLAIGLMYWSFGFVQGTRD
jgi:glycosyltransferase involved in cell wall biosynthesis